MMLILPYPLDLIEIARKVAWYDAPEQAASDLPAFWRTPWCTERPGHLGDQALGSGVGTP